MGVESSREVVRRSTSSSSEASFPPPQPSLPTNANRYLVNLLATRFKVLKLSDELNVVGFTAYCGNTSLLLVLEHGGLAIWDLNSNQVICKGKDVASANQVDRGVVHLTDIVATDSGDDLYVALSGTGHVFTWGKVKDGQLGRTDIAYSMDGRALPGRVLFPASSPICQIGCGARHVVALDKAGQVYSWGSDDGGRLGQGHSMSNAAPTLIKSFLATKVRVIQISVGQHHSLALSADCRAFSWGMGKNGKLGHRGSQNEYCPREIEQLSLAGGNTISKVSTQYPICQVAAGDQHSALLTSAGYLFTFGDNEHNKLGHNTEDLTLEHENVPRLVESLSNDGLFISSVCCSSTFTLILCNSGKLVVAGKLPRDGTNVSRLKKPRFLELQSFNASALSLGQCAFVVQQERRRGSSTIEDIDLVISPVPPIPPISEFLDKETSEKPHDEVPPSVVCSYHARYADTPLSVHLSSGYLGMPKPTTSCPHCSQEMIVSLGKQLREQHSYIKTLKGKLSSQRTDARAYRELCMRKENTENAVKMLLSKMESLELHSSVMYSFAALVRDTVEGLHARVLELEMTNSDLEKTNKELKDRLDQRSLLVDEIRGTVPLSTLSSPAPFESSFFSVNIDDLENDPDDEMLLSRHTSDPFLQD